VTSGHPTRHVVLVGLMASGKSTVGTLLAARLGQAFVDNDVALEARTGRSASEIVAADGADALHALEASTLLDALDGTEPAVVAAAAAAVLEPSVVASLRNHVVVYLRAAPEVLAARIRNETDDDGHRPFVADDAGRVLAEQFAARDERYRRIATLVVDAGGGAERVVDEIMPVAGPAPGR
jgi:shikimate kinase